MTCLDDHQKFRQYATIMIQHTGRIVKCHLTFFFGREGSTSSKKLLTARVLVTEPMLERAVDKGVRFKRGRVALREVRFASLFVDSGFGGESSSHAKKSSVGAAAAGTDEEFEE